VPRTHTNKKQKNTTSKKKRNLLPNPKKIKLIINLIKIIFIYSAKKIKANPPEEYSTLKPDTNSDSPSAKSKGVRLVSAKQETNHIKNKGIKKKLIMNTPEFSKIYLNYILQLKK